MAGYNAWLRMHRYVKRGERAIKIIVPMSKKVETDDGEQERKLIFGTGNVFDISQTDGEPLPAIAVPTLEGSEGVGLLLGLYELAQTEGLNVQNVPAEVMPSDTMMGYYDPERRSITVREAAPLQMTKTLAHELGHHFAGHARSDSESETAAEAIAYVVCARFGLDTGERSFPYIATWAKDKKILQQALGTIQKVSATIIDRLAPQGVEPDAPAPMAGGAPMKHYKGYSEDAGSAMGPEIVFVQEDEQPPYRLKHEVYHSPDGFSWGYSGSGPADLARSILADHLGYVPSSSVYQPFKSAYVARWEQGKPWHITSEEIERFLAQPKIAELLEEQRQDEALEREIAELVREAPAEQPASPDAEDPFWTHDHQLSVGRLYEQEHAIRLKLHRAAERFDHRGDAEIIPLPTQHGERLYFLAKPYILIPDIRVQVQFSASPTAGDQGLLGEVTGSEWTGMRHEEVGSVQAWYYPADKTLVLWEVVLHRHHRQQRPVGDPNLAAVWQGFERVLLEHCPGAELLATPFDDPNYERSAYQDFLRSQGYRPIAQAAFGKRIGDSRGDSSDPS